MKRRRIKVDPALFLESEWTELSWATGLVPREYMTKSVRRSEGAIYNAIQSLRNKQESIREGALGQETYSGEDREWISSLRGAEVVLGAILKKEMEK